MHSLAPDFEPVISEEHSFFIHPSCEFQAVDNEFQGSTYYNKYNWNKDGSFSTEIKQFNKEDLCTGV
jgi:hypothetical protein